MQHTKKEGSFDIKGAKKQPLCSDTTRGGNKQLPLTKLKRKKGCVFSFYFLFFIKSWYFSSCSIFIRGRRSPAASGYTRPTSASPHLSRRSPRTPISQSMCCLVSKTWVRHTAPSQPPSFRGSESFRLHCSTANQTLDVIKHENGRKHVEFAGCVQTFITEGIKTAYGHRELCRKQYKCEITVFYI